MLPSWTRLAVVLFCLCLFLQVSTSSQSFALIRRQDESTPEQTPEPTRADDSDEEEPTAEADDDDDKEEPTDEAEDGDEESGSATASESGDETEAASESGSPTETSGLDSDDLESKNSYSPLVRPLTRRC